jgi:hypothetical protein
MGKSFVVIEAGSEETFAVAAKWVKRGGFLVEAFHRQRSSGMTDGAVAEIYPASEHIRSLISGLSRKTGISFQEVYAGISSPTVEVLPSTGSLLISRYGREISPRDVKKCIEIGSLARIPLDREVLHKIVMGFSVDGERLIRDPEGLEAVKLGVEVNIVTISVTSIRNFSKSISQAGYVPSGFVLSALGSSARILSEDDKMDKTAFVSVRGNKTEVLLFSSGNLENCVVFDRTIGGKSAETGGIDDADKYAWFARSVSAMRGWNDMRRIVVSGTKTPNEDFLRFVEKEFALPVREACPQARPFEDLPEDGACYASALGVLDCIANFRCKGKTPMNPVKKAVNKVAGFLEEYF